MAFIHPSDRVPQPGFGGPSAKAARTRTHKYIRYINQESELYDLETDPHELESIHETADPSLVADLKGEAGRAPYLRRAIVPGGRRHTEDGNHTLAESRLLAQRQRRLA